MENSGRTKLVQSLMFLQNNPRLNPLIIIDNNKIQSDTWVKKK